MVAFEVKVNGKKVCTAGVADFGVLTTILTWVRRKAARTGQRARRHGAEEELTLDVSGLNGDEHLKWIASSLHVGDRVSIRVLDAKAVDVPTRRYHDDPQMVKKAKRRYYEQLKREYGE